MLLDARMPPNLRKAACSTNRNPVTAIRDLAQLRNSDVRQLSRFELARTVEHHDLGAARDRHPLARLFMQKPQRSFKASRSQQLIVVGIRPHPEIPVAATPASTALAA